MKTDLFQSCGHCWVFQICWHIKCSIYTASSFKIWNSSTGILSPPLALFIMMLLKAQLPSHSRMSGSRWVVTSSWLSGSWRSFYFPGNSGGKASACSEGDPSSIPGKGNGNPLQYSCLENSMDRGAYSQWDRKESDKGPQRVYASRVTQNYLLSRTLQHPKCPHWGSISLFYRAWVQREASYKKGSINLMHPAWAGDLFHPW